MNFGMRLEAVASLVPPCQTLVDVGTDHAYLPVLLLQQGKIQQAIAGDVVPGPCEAARHTVRAFHLEDRITVRQGSGLTVVAPGEAEAAVMAGMGAGTMLQILAEAPAVWQHPGFRHLILQPMSDACRLRHWAEDNGWAIVREELAREGKRLYELLHLEPSPGWRYPSTCYEIGSDLIQRHHPLLEDLLAERKKKLHGLLEQMGRSERARASRQYEEYQTLWKQLEAIARGNGRNGNERNHRNGHLPVHE